MWSKSSRSILEGSNSYFKADQYPQTKFNVYGRKGFPAGYSIEKMLKDLNCITQIVPCHIIREDDGLAMSNEIYLNPEQRKQALCLFKAIQQAQTQYKQGIRETIFLQKETQI